jgi:pimeloyl-ACP methyl ester carboxylesterase
VRKPVLQFSHANGFPARCYGAMLAAFRDRYRVGAIEAIGTDPRYPVTEGWLHLVEQLEQAIERDWHGEPVYGLGHSLGGYITFLAAVRRPELFHAIVLLDAPIVGPIKGRLLGATKRFGIVDRVTPAGATRDRRSEWPSREEAKAHFRTRRLFRHFTEECLEDYVRHALVEAHGARRGGGGHLRLRIDPEIEYRIYRTIPHDMSRHLKRLQVPAAFVGGADSDVVRRVGMSLMRGPRFLKRQVPGGHLFPFEHPPEAAAAILELLQELQ